jgi:hypothetical protein
MNTTDFVEQWYSMQKAFLPPPEILASSKENARRFWTVCVEPSQSSA